MIQTKRIDETINTLHTVLTTSKDGRIGYDDAILFLKVLAARFAITVANARHKKLVDETQVKFVDTVIEALADNLDYEREEDDMGYFAEKRVVEAFAEAMIMRVQVELHSKNKMGTSILPILPFLIKIVEAENE